MERVSTTTQSSFGMTKKEMQLRAVRSKLGKDNDRKVYRPMGRDLKKSLNNYLHDHKDD